MALFNGLDRTKFLEELATPLNTQSGVRTPAWQRARMLRNLYGDSVDGLRLPGAAAGTVTTPATTAVVELGDGLNHLTKLTLTNFAVGTSGDNASLAIGAKIYTFPAGTIIVDHATIAGGVTAAISVTTDTPEVGLGTVIGSGAVAVLSTTLEDIIDGGAAGLTGGDAIAPNVAGGAFYKGETFTTGVVIKASGGKSHDVFLNVADGWADVTAAGAVTFTGVITLAWRKVD